MPSRGRDGPWKRRQQASSSARSSTSSYEDAFDDPAFFMHHILISVAFSPLDYILRMREWGLSDHQIDKTPLLISSYRIASLLAGTSEVSECSLEEQRSHAVSYFLLLTLAPPLFNGGRAVVPGTEGLDKAARMERLVKDQPALAAYFARARSITGLHLLIRRRLLELDSLGAEHSRGHRREQRRSLARGVGELRFAALTILAVLYTLGTVLPIVFGSAADAGRALGRRFHSNGPFSWMAGV